MCSIQGRALHYVFKVGDRNKTIHFFRDVLGMKILRHEEFSEGCEAQCNGPYANRWSKTMMGYGPESTHFAVELTYNYGVKSYEKGNDFRYITIRSAQVMRKALKENWPIFQDNILEAPGGYRFKIIDEPPQSEDEDPVVMVSLACSNIEKSLEYYSTLLGMNVLEYSLAENGSAIFAFGENQTKLELIPIKEPINRAQAYGRIAFACPWDEQPIIEEVMKKRSMTILKPLISLETPGKAAVRVIILADPDGHEICFVDSEGFDQLCQVDPEAEKLLNRYISKDRS